MKISLFSKFLRWRIKHISDRNFILVLSVVVGIAAGLTALGLKTSVFYLRNLLLSDFEFDYRNYLILIYPTIGIALTMLMKHYLIHDPVKHSVGSILHAISRRNSLMPRHKMFSSMLGGIFTAGFGGSIGLELPIISSGAAIGSNLARLLHLNYKTITLLLACGASGAIAGIFNTPIAGLVFALEVLLLDLTRFSLVPLLMASTSGTIITHAFFPKELLFDFQVADDFHVHFVPFYIAFAVLIGIFSFYFTRMFLFVERKMEGIRKPLLRLLAGGLLLGTMLFLFPPLFGEGFGTIKQILGGDYTTALNTSLFANLNHNFYFVLGFFVLLALLKVVATATTIGAGGIGGIFAPSLFTGAIAGFLFAAIYNALGFETQLSESNFALVGMASMLAGVLHAPLTGIFLIAEITSGYELIVPLMLTSTLTFVTIKYLEPNSIFTMHLAKRGELITHHKDKAVLSFMRLGSLIETDLKTVPISATLGDLVKIVAKSRRNIFPVLDPKGVLVGIVLLDDIREIMFNRQMYQNVSVRSLMHQPPAYIMHTDSMETVMKKFKQTNAWNLPVLREGKYAGFVSKSKMFSVYRRLLVNLTEE